MIPKMGNVLPKCPGETPQESSYQQLVAEALRTELGDSHRALKTIMRWTGVSERTAKNWYLGAAGPSGTHLLELVKHSDTVYEAFFNRAERKHAITVRKLRTTKAVVRDLLSHLDDVTGDQGIH